MSELTEKLGIKPILMYEGGGGYYVDGEQVRKLEQQNAELLEVLIRQELSHAKCNAVSESIVKIIEKATGKTWQEIKQLIGE